MDESLLYYSYKLLNLIQTKCSKKVVKKFINNVHSQFSIYNGEKLKKSITLNWYSSLTPSNLELIRHSVNGIVNIKGGLLSSKNIPHICFDHNIKWIHSLLIASDYLNCDTYIYIICQLILTLSEKNIDFNHFGVLWYPKKMTINFNTPIGTEQNKCASLDITIIISELLSILKKKKNSINSLYITLLSPFLNRKVSHDYYTNDPYEIGHCLINCLHIRKIITLNRNYYPIYESLIKCSLQNLKTLKFDIYIQHSFAYKWLELCRGLYYIKILDSYYKNKYVFYDKYHIRIKHILQYYRLIHRINTNFKTYSLNKNENENNAINSIVYAINQPYF